MATAQKKRMTKSQIVGELADKTNMSKKDIALVFEGLRDLIKRELGSRGPGEFVVPEVNLKLKLRKTPAQKGRKFPVPGKPGEFVIRDVPAGKKLRATALKKLKEMVL
jgi:nucleoid DNA-binding protein